MNKIYLTQSVLDGGVGSTNGNASERLGSVSITNEGIVWRDTFYIRKYDRQQFAEYLEKKNGFTGDDLSPGYNGIPVDRQLFKSHALKNITTRWGNFHKPRDFKKKFVEEVMVGEIKKGTVTH